MPNRFGIPYLGAQYNSSVMIYHGDGSVAIAHGGIDMGQGIQTKVSCLVRNSQRWENCTFCVVLSDVAMDSGWQKYKCPLLTPV